MSTFFNKNSVIGGPPDEPVLKQLAKRTELLKKGSLLSSDTARTTEDLLVLNSNNGWVRMMSSVDVFDPKTEKYSSDLAKKYVMLGGSLYKSPGKDTYNKKEGFSYSKNKLSLNSSYEKSSVQGFVPMPGITNFLVQSKNQFGTLRVGTVEFQANSIEQLSELERLFLRPGFSVLVEWGHSIYIDNDGNRKNGHPGISPKEFFEIKSKKEIVKRILKEKENSSCNYDAVFAFIKNFTWSFSKYGTYDCKVDIVSMGEIVESLKVIIDPDVTKFGSTSTTSDDTNQNENTTPLHQFLYAIKNIANAEGANIDKAQLNKITLIEEALAGTGKYVNWHKFPKSNPSPATEDNPSPSAYFEYIPLYLILEVINQTMVLKDSEGNIVSFYSGGDKSLLRAPLLRKVSEGPVTPFVTFAWHYILDPRIGFLPKKSKQDVGFNFPTTVSTPYIENDITDICVNIDFALSTLNSVCQQPEITDQVLISFIKNLLTGIQDSAGNINDFALHYEEDDFMFFIIDRNITPPGNSKAEINLVGLGSSIESLNISSRLTNKIGNIVAISAQAANTDAGDELFAMQKWNVGLEDRIITERGYGDPDTNSSETGTKNNITYNDSSLQVARLLKHIKEIETEFGGQYTLEDKGSTDIAGLKALHRRLMSRLVYNTTVQAGTSYPGLIPLNLQLRMLGIGSLKVGQVFHIPDLILPSAYRGEINEPKIGFMIFDPAHTISNGRWVTDLRCGMVMTQKNEKSDGISIEMPVEELKQNSDIANIALLPVTDGKARKDVQEYVTSQNGVDLIKSSEGLKLEAYPDPGTKGKPITIGYGTTVMNGKPVLPEQKITEQYAETLLKQDLKRTFEKGVKTYVKVPVSQGEFDALVSFAYNCGIGNLAKSTLLQYTNSGQYELASEEFVKWNKAAGKVLPGLTKRRLKEANMFRTS